MEERLPFEVSSRPWSEVAEGERNFFCGDKYLPLPPQHAAQIRLLAPVDATRLASWAFASIPPGWPDRTDVRYRHEVVLNVSGCWDDAARRADVTRWLFRRGIPFRRAVYLMYERDQVVSTTWRMIVRYWAAFAWSVGYAMVAVDHTLKWACCFHHEDVFVFGSQEEQRRTRRFT